MDFNRKPFTCKELIDQEYDEVPEDIDQQFNVDPDKIKNYKPKINWYRLAAYEYHGVFHVTWVAKVPSGWILRHDGYIEEPDANDPDKRVTIDFNFDIQYIHDPTHKKRFQG